MIPAHKDLKNPPGQTVNRDWQKPAKDANGVTAGFDRYPWLKTSSAGPEKAPISPAKRLGDIIDEVVARSSEPASKPGYTDNQIAQACMSVGIPDSKFEDLMVVLQEAVTTKWK